MYSFVHEHLEYVWISASSLEWWEYWPRLWPRKFMNHNILISFMFMFVTEHLCFKEWHWPEHFGQICSDFWPQSNSHHSRMKPTGDVTRFPAWCGTRGTKSSPAPACTRRFAGQSLWSSTCRLRDKPTGRRSMGKLRMWWKQCDKQQIYHSHEPWNNGSWWYAIW